MLNKIINLKFWNFTSYSWKKAFSIAAYILALISSALSIIGVSFQNIRELSFGIWIIILIFVYFLIALIIRIILSMQKEYIIKVRNNKIKIKVGDIFQEEGLRLIPFNEYFDTTVDDNKISRNTLHGKFLINCKIDISELKNSILESKDPKSLQRKETDRGVKFPLGRIVKYLNKYLLLAFSHFDQDDVAYITRIEYEKCLATMWKELRRTYSGEPINLPLIGSGITKFVDLPEKSNLDLLKCMICTLKFSKEQFQNDIKIIVTEDVWNDLDLVNNILEL